MHGFITGVRDQFNAVIKCALSFTKRDWDFEDYPIRTWKIIDPHNDHLPYAAGLTNWQAMITQGESPEKAMIPLKTHFEDAKKKGWTIRRPGTFHRLKVVFESGDNILRNEDLGYEFLDRIFGIKYVFFSDVTKLIDFESVESKEQTIGKIKESYGVDVTDIFDEPLWKILDRKST